MQVTEDVIRSVVQEVLSHMNPARPVARSVTAAADGVFDDVELAVRAAATAQREFERRGLNDRRKAVACIRSICVEQAQTLGRMELEETGIGRLAPLRSSVKRPSGPTGFSTGSPFSRPI